MNRLAVVRLALAGVVAAAMAALIKRELESPGFPVDGPAR